jgi:hypothetical protein
MVTTAVLGHLEFVEREWTCETEWLGVISHADSQGIHFLHPVERKWETEKVYPVLTF